MHAQAILATLPRHQRVIDSSVESPPSGYDHEPTRTWEGVEESVHFKHPVLCTTGGF